MASSVVAAESCLVPPPDTQLQTPNTRYPDHHHGPPPLPPRRPPRRQLGDRPGPAALPRPLALDREGAPGAPRLAGHHPNPEPLVRGRGGRRRVRRRRDHVFGSEVRGTGECRAPSAERRRGCAAGAAPAPASAKPPSILTTASAPSAPAQFALTVIAFDEATGMVSNKPGLLINKATPPAPAAEAMEIAEVAQE